MPIQKPINSTTLKQTFPQIYRDFFTPCQRVASASLSFLWAGEFSGFHDGLMLGQKLPLKLYVGFESTSSGRVVINDQYHAYNAHTGTFEQQTLDTRLAGIITEYLSKRFSNVSTFTGLSVRFLSEVPFGHSLGSHGAIAAALALLLSPNNSTFDIQLRTARDILSRIQSGHSSGLSAYMALCDASSPVVFAHIGDTHIAKPLHELAGLQQLPAWPFDYTLIYTGSQVNTESVVQASTTSTTELDQIAHDIATILPEYRTQNYTQVLMNMLNMTAGMSIHGLLELFAKGPSRDRLEHFFNTLNQYQNLLQMLHVSSPMIDQIYATIHSMANKQTNEVGSGIKISGVGKGGVMICALPYGMYRAELPKMIEKLAHQTNREICLDYTSWVDGYSTEPGLIEQDLARKQYSSFVRHNSVTVQSVVKGQVTERILTQEQYEQDLGQFDIVFDQTNGKVTVAGKGLTSKDLPSQKATVAIMSQLLISSKFELNNNQISDSYGVNRYDLQGKIVIPLTRTVKKRTGRDLQLHIHGDMYDQYTLSINPGNVTFAIVESKH